jgi:hypothetical protein
VPALYLLGDDIGKLFSALSRKGPKALAS